MIPKPCGMRLESWGVFDFEMMGIWDSLWIMAFLEMFDCVKQVSCIVHTGLVDMEAQPSMDDELRRK